MNEYQVIRKSLWRRFLIGGPFLLSGLVLMAKVHGWFRGTAAPERYSALGPVLLACACLITGAIILAIPLARLLAQPATGLFFPNEHFDRPQPIYGIPRTRRGKGLFEEAITEYEKLVEEYPEEIEAWIEMMEVAAIDLRDADRADEILDRSLGAVESESERAKLKETRARMRDRVRAESLPLL